MLRRLHGACRFAISRMQITRRHIVHLGPVVLAVVTAVVSSGSHGAHSAAATLHAFRPGLGIVTGAAALGLLVALSAALSGRRTALLATTPSGTAGPPILEQEDIREAA